MDEQSSAPEAERGRIVHRSGFERNPGDRCSQARFTDDKNALK
jgi:hypothetical protein